VKKSSTSSEMMISTTVLIAVEAQKCCSCVVPLVVLAVYPWEYSSSAVCIQYECSVYAYYSSPWLLANVSAGFE
jgi:hypothetical protein